MGEVDRTEGGEALSFPVPAAKKPEPVQLDQVWEYGTRYHRVGRVWVKRRIRADFWECQETERGDVRNYDTDDLISIAALTKIQPGQNWIDSSKRLCRIDRPEFTSSGYGFGYKWMFGRADLGSLTQSTSEFEILTHWTLVVGTVGKGQLCPLCGSPGQSMAVLFDCSSSSCRNYSNRRGTP